MTNKEYVAAIRYIVTLRTNANKYYVSNAEEESDCIYNDSVGFDQWHYVIDKAKEVQRAIGFVFFEDESFDEENFNNELDKVCPIKY